MLHFILPGLVRPTASSNTYTRDVCLRLASQFNSLEETLNQPSMADRPTEIFLAEVELIQLET